MNKVVHFEVPYDDKKRVHSFYEKVFGWKFQDIPDMDYLIARTVEVDKKQMPKEKGAINGGMYKRGEKSSKTPVLVVDVSNIEEHIKKVISHGGSVFMPTHKVGEMGIYAQVRDTEGNIIGIWQKLPARVNK
jgi:uncharacterized protein